MLDIHFPTTSQSATEVFYCTHFGFVRKIQHEAIVWIESSSGQMLGLEEVESVQPFPPSFKLVFQVPSVERIQSLRHELSASGHVVEPASSSSPHANDSFVVNDPDGRRVLVAVSSGVGQNAA